MALLVTRDMKPNPTRLSKERNVSWKSEVASFRHGGIQHLKHSQQDLFSYHLSVLISRLRHFLIEWLLIASDVHPLSFPSPAI
jgi:hypothetical protein